MTDKDEVVIGEYEAQEEKEVDTTEAEAVIEEQVKEATPPSTQQQQDKIKNIFAGSTLERVEKKLTKGKKITSQEAFRSMMEMRQIMGGVIHDLQKMANALQSHEMAMQNIFANLQCILKICENKGVFKEEEYKATWEEEVVKPQREAQEKAQKAAMEQAKKEAVEAVKAKEENIHPDCHYCGKEDCEFCGNKIIEKSCDDSCDNCKCEEPKES